MPKLSEIVGLDEGVDVDFSNLPDQFSLRNPLPQPGAGYVFRLPSISPNDDNWIPDLTNDDNKPRIGYSFSEGKELILLQAPGITAGGPGSEILGQAIRWRLTNQEKSWDAEKSAASPMAHLIYHAFGIELPKGAPNSSWVKALIAISGRAFGGTVNWTAYCNPKRDIYMPADEDRGIEGGQVKGHPGCGQRYALKQRTNKKTAEVTMAIPRDASTGKYEERFLCAGIVSGEQCPALVSCFLDIQNFRECPEEFKHLRAAAQVTSAPVKEPEPSKDAKGEGNGKSAEQPEQPKKPAQVVSAKPAAEKQA